MDIDTKQNRAGVPTIDGLRRAFSRVAPGAFLCVLPVALICVALARAHADGQLAVDFHHELYPEAKLVLAGDDPFPPADADLSDGTNTIWPIAAILPVLPLALLPSSAADWLMTVAVMLSFVGALVILGIRDWRVYGAVGMWPAFINATQTANVTLPLCLLVAIGWRMRDRWLVAGAAVGAAVAMKFFLWPVALLFAAQRRVAAALTAAVIAAASLLLLLPFISLADYVRLLRNLSDTFDGLGYTLYALLVDVGVGNAAAKVVWLAAGLATLGLAVKLRSFALTIGASLLLSPIVWLHSFALLALPLAVVAPRFRSVWLVPLVLWLVPGTGNGAMWQTGLALAVAAGVVAFSARVEERSTARPHIAAGSA